MVASLPIARDRALAPALLDGSPYQSYVYAYPHKTAYRAIDPPISFADAFANERRDALFLYVHVPWCETRCGFCNLFAAPRPSGGELIDWTLALERQARVIADAIPDAKFQRFAMGGGTPSILDVDSLERLFAIVEKTMGADLSRVPGSVEASPVTIDRDKLALLSAHGVDRISVGVQSFDEAEAAAVNRPQRRVDVLTALENIRRERFPTLNVDLIYGLPGQTRASFLRSITEALEFRPEELYLYPLYARARTALDRLTTDDAMMLAMYRDARAMLLSRGYSQRSMRLFRAKHAPEEAGAVYDVQDDGMIGLGCGARSYTREVHASSEWAVSSKGVRSIVEAWCDRPSHDYARIDHGFRLDRDEQKRRWIALALLGDGVDLAAYQRRFGTDARTDLGLGELVERGLASDDSARFTLTEAGVERWDAIGPWLASPRVRQLMNEYVVR